MNIKILTSILSLVTALSVAGGATYAYFTSQQNVLGNTFATGTMNFQGIITNTSGDSSGDNGKFSVSNLAPGQSLIRCLWVKNTGNVAGRYKIYAYAESGNNELGNMLKINATLNDATCLDITTHPLEGTLYGPPSGLAKDEWKDVGARGTFLSASATPFKILKTEPAMEGGYFSVFKITVKLDSNATQQGTSYVNDIAIYGMQAEGSGTDSDW